LAGGNRLTLNLKKTEHVYFAGTRPPEVAPGGLVINGEQVRRVEGLKFLGVRVEAELKWRGHIDQVGGRCGGSWGCQVEPGANLNECLLISLYNSMVLPHLQY
jgi:hypothetical protein